MGDLLYIIFAILSMVLGLALPDLLLITKWKWAEVIYGDAIAIARIAGMGIMFSAYVKIVDIIFK